MSEAVLSKERIEVLERIKKYEQEGGDSFFKDVENDPAPKELKPEDVDYLNKKFINKVKRLVAYKIGNVLRHKAKKIFQIKVEGIENAKGITGGAIITSNHFAHFESACISCVVKELNKRSKLKIVIREGNYTMPGLFGFLFRHCDTLPLSSNLATMKHFNYALSDSLSNNQFVLVYPEQSMWWNYRKPRPQKSGAAYFAARNNVPIIPCFVTMKDTDKLDNDGYPIQQYTIHVMKPIFPDNTKTPKENAISMTELNYQLCKEKYEEVYNTQLVY